MAKLLIMVCAAAFAIGVAHAITYTVGAGDTQTATGVTYSERVEKLGDGTLVFTGNNSLSTLTGGAYGHTDNGVLLVTNGTFDATGLSGEFRNGSTGSFSSSRIVIDNGCVVKAGTLRPVGGEAGTESKKESFGVDLNAGGSLYVNTFCVDDGSCYGRINFNGGVLYPTQKGTSDASSRQSRSCCVTTPQVRRITGRRVSFAHRVTRMAFCSAAWRTRCQRRQERVCTLSEGHEDHREVRR